MVAGIELRQFHQSILTLLNAYDTIQLNNSEFRVSMMQDERGEDQYEVKRLYRVDKK